MTPQREVVEWNKEHNGFYPFYDDEVGPSPEFVEVIGNIHEHPELLTKEP